MTTQSVLSSPGQTADNSARHRTRSLPRLRCPSRITVSFLLALLFCCGAFPAGGLAGDNLFNSGTAIKSELARLSEEGKLFVTAPADPYLAQSAAVAGAFALSYVFDKEIRSDLAANHSGTLKSLTGGGSFVGDPFLHIGVAAALYGVGALSETPGFMRLGEELGEALFLADGTTFILKEAVGRGRPATGDGNGSYRPFQFKNDYDSLPSMHTASSFAVAHVLAFHTTSLPVKILCYAGAGFVAFSRLYQEKHWTSDLVIGAAIGELAGDSVTRFRTLQKGELTVAPLSMGGVPSLALLGKF